VSELKLCPFCGRPPEYVYTESTIRYGSHIVRCVDPGCICNVRPEAEVLADSDIEPADGFYFVADEWNRRPLEAALEARVKELEYLDGEASIGAKELMDENKRLQAELAQAEAAAVQWVEYDGTEVTRPKRWGNEFNIGAVMFFTPLCGGTVMVARMMPFSACRFPSDIDPEDIPDDFEPDEWVWQRVDKFDVVWLARPGDRWAYLPKPIEGEL